MSAMRSDYAFALLRLVAMIAQLEVERISVVELGPEGRPFIQFDFNPATKRWRITYTEWK